MTKEHYFAKVRTALRSRGATRNLNMSETVRVCGLQQSGFSPVSAAKVIISGRVAEDALEDFNYVGSRHHY